MFSLALPAHAGGKAQAVKKVYLKDGGILESRSAWRSKGKVYVLVNRDILAEFHPSELDMKRTFSRHAPQAYRKHSSTKKRRPAGAVITSHAAQQVPEKKFRPSLPNLPSLKLPKKTPPSLDNTEEGAIRKHKREMSERVNA